MSAYKGLYVQRLSDGLIHSVQVQDVGGIGLPLSPLDYVNREISPPIQTLPDEDQYYKELGNKD